MHRLFALFLLLGIAAAAAADDKVVDANEARSTHDRCITLRRLILKHLRNFDPHLGPSHSYDSQR